MGNTNLKEPFSRPRLAISEDIKKQKRPLTVFFCILKGKMTLLVVNHNSRTNSEGGNDTDRWLLSFESEEGFTD